MIRCFAFIFLFFAANPTIDFPGFSDKTEVLELQLSYELQHLRIDIIRQQDQSMVDDVPSYTDRPYHPVGFDLGFGLFFDLNRNLSLRIDQLMELSSSPQYKIQQWKSPAAPKVVGHFTRQEARYCRKWKGLLGVNSEKCDSIHFSGEDVGLEVWSNERLRQSLSVKGKGKYQFANGANKGRGKIDILEKQKGYEVFFNKKGRGFEKIDGGIQLGRGYRVEYDIKSAQVNVFQTRGRKKKLIRTIQVRPDQLKVGNASKSLFWVHKKAETIEWGKPNRNWLERYELVSD